MNDRTRDILPLVVLVALVLGAMTIPMGAFIQGAPITVEALFDRGLKVDELVAAGEVGRLVTAGLVHTSIVHLLINALSLVVVSVFWWRLAVPLRPWSRAWVVVSILVVSSTAGFMASYWAHMGPSGGASAGIYGLFAAVAAAAWMQRAARELGWVTPLALTLLSALLVVAMLGKSGMDHAAHAGGWVTGFVSGLGAFTASGRVVLGALTIAALGMALV